MAVAEVSPAHERFAAPPHEIWRGRAFGITLESAGPFPGLPLCADAAPGRIATWHQDRARAIDEAWSLEDAEVVVDLRHTDGRVFMRIDRHADDGYRIWAPYYGRHLVSADGCSIRSALPNVSPWRWQRLFFSQTLPLAAALQGLEVFHASAVSIGGRVAAFAASSGTGKTAVAAHLVALGATFVTDDVLAIEAVGDSVVAHPGPARLSIDDSEFRRIPDGQLSRLGVPIGRSDKLTIEPEPATAPLPLTGLYFLKRPASDVSRVTIKEAEATSARSLLGSGFLAYLDTPERLRDHVDGRAAIAERTRLYEVLIPKGARAREVAATTLAHADGFLHHAG
jgi:hypothetical protein